MSLFVFKQYTAKVVVLGYNLFMYHVYYFDIDTIGFINMRNTSIDKLIEELSNQTEIIMTKMEKTIVFCVDIDHARTVARLLQNEFGEETGLHNYAGEFRFTSLPAGRLQLIVNATGFVDRTLSVETIADETIRIEVPLKPEGPKSAKIRVQGLEVTIADEALFLIEKTGQQLTLAQYRNYTRERVVKVASNRQKLQEIWIDSKERQQFLEELRHAGIHAEVLAEVLRQPEADTYDLLCHIAFGDPVRTRSERATAFQHRDQAFLKGYPKRVCRVILALLEKYRLGGIDQLEPEVFNLSPFGEWGGAFNISQWLGGPSHLGHLLNEIRKRLYAE